MGCPCSALNTRFAGTTVDGLYHQQQGGMRLAGLGKRIWAWSELWELVKPCQAGGRQPGDRAFGAHSARVLPGSILGDV